MIPSPKSNHLTTTREPPQTIPVHISNGNRPKQSAPRPQPVQQRQVQTPTSDKKVLLLGDSILKGVNSKGLTKGVHKNSLAGATIQDLCCWRLMYVFIFLVKLR